MDKRFIISEIQRTAENGKASGQRRFTSETGIKAHEWRGKYWARWGDALIEAGFSQNEWTSAHGEGYVIECLLRTTRLLGKFPTKDEIGLARNDDPNIVSYAAVARLGTRAQLKDKLLKFCADSGEYTDIEEVIRSIPIKETLAFSNKEDDVEITNGYVYLVDAQDSYKIGSTRAPYRRVAEIANQSAKGAELLHLISTDDPEGIERYWHRRFHEKKVVGINKQSGEWFSLSAEDIRAFKRRKSM